MRRLAAHAARVLKMIEQSHEFLPTDTTRHLSNSQGRHTDVLIQSGHHCATEVTCIRHVCVWLVRCFSPTQLLPRWDASKVLRSKSVLRMTRIVSLADCTASTTCTRFDALEAGSLLTSENVCLVSVSGFMNHLWGPWLTG